MISVIKLLVFTTALLSSYSSFAIEDLCRAYRTTWQRNNSEDNLKAWNDCLDEAPKHQAWLDQQAKEKAALPTPRIGMTQKQVTDRTNWGQPESINTTTSSGRTTEQWVYGVGKYLYFTHGKLTAIQNSTR